MDRLRHLLDTIDGRGYKAYKALTGRYRFDDFLLSIDHVQGDPFADPSRMSVQVPAQRAGFPAATWDTPVRRIALEDFVARALAAAIGRRPRRERGSGRSGRITVATSAQQVLRRNAVLIDGTGVEARITVGLPAAGRRILGGEARAMLLEELPALVRAALHYASLPQEELWRQLCSVEDQQALRAHLQEAGWAAFVADGSRLPRRSGIDDRPLADDVVPLQAPDGLARTVHLPHAGPVRGLAVPRGVTLIVGGGFHGKSTLLHALERGVYDHVPGDGRERVVTDGSAVKVRAEDGRAVNRVDISPFIDRLPYGRDTRAFTSGNASGSTSQAAAIVEALAGGCRVLLVDEDTAAGNFMIRDRRMQRLVHAAQEPITPFLHRVRELWEVHGISTILVMGGSGDYFEVADTVLMLDRYHVRDVTATARALAGDDLARLDRSGWPPLAAHAARRPGPGTLDASRGHYAARVDVADTHRLRYGEHEVDLHGLEQLVDRGQTEAIGWLLHYYARHWPEADAVSGLRRALALVERQGLDVVLPWKSGTLALPRLQELTGALNRIRGDDWYAGEDGATTGAAGP